MMWSVTYLKNNVIRVLEKVPGVNLQQVLEINGVYFIMVPKCGTRSIRDCFLNVNGLSLGEEWHHIRYMSKSQVTKLSRSRHVVCFIRDSNARLFSCWKQKITRKRDRGLFYFWQYLPLIRPDMAYESFLKAVTLIPAIFAEKHFRPLSVTVDFREACIEVKPLTDLDAYLYELTGIKVPRANVVNTVGVSAVNVSERYNSKLLERFKLDDAAVAENKCEV